MTAAKITAGRYTVEVVDRVTGARRWVARSGRIEAEFTRLLDSTSTADITTVGGVCEFDGVLPRRDELVIRRDGRLVWVGPVLRMREDQDAGDVTLSAVDRSFWFGGAPVVDVFTFDGHPLVAFDVLLDVCEKFAPSGLVFRPHVPDDDTVAVSVVVEPGRSAWSEMAELAKTYVDWCVIGDEMLIGSPEILVAEGGTLSQHNHWTSDTVTVDVDGGDIADCVVVRGSNGIVGLFPAEAGSVSVFGRRCLFVDAQNVATVDEAVALARFTWALHRTLDTRIDTGSRSLSADAPVRFSGLIPGRKFTIAADAGCWQTVEPMRLSKVTVRFGSVAGGDGWVLGGERVAVDFVRLGVEGE